MGGLTFSLFAQCAADDAGCKIGIFAISNVPAGSFYSFNFEINACGKIKHWGSSPMIVGSTGRGFGDFFCLGAMAGGWDPAAWAAKGLPASGELPITLTVTQVAHSGIS